MPAPSQRDALSFLWSGQDGYVGLFRDPVQRERRFFASPEQAIAEAHHFTYFTPIPLLEAKATKENVAPFANLLWIEADAPGVAKNGAPASEEQLEALREHLDDAFARLGLPPSLLLYSGSRGFHAYWKLSRKILTEDVERLNKALAKFFDSDKSHPAALRRIPEAIHAHTGKRAAILDFLGASYPPEPFFERLPQTDNKQTRLERRSDVPYEFKRVPPPARPLLPNDLWEYIAARPNEGEGWDRSLYELHIFRKLAEQGWSDDEIVSFVFKETLSKHMSRWNRDSGSCTRDNIREARVFLQETRGIVTNPEGGPVLANGLVVPVGHTVADFTAKLEVEEPVIDRGSVIWLIRGQRTIDFLEEVVDRTGCNIRTAERILAQFKSGDYVNSTLKPPNRKTKYLHLTEEAREAMTFERFDKLKNSLVLPPALKASAPISSLALEELELWMVRRPDELRLTP